MAQESKLINLTSNLKLLKFGSDRPDSGDSNQPYYQADLPEGTGYGRDGLPTRSGPDFILRDGFLAPVKGFRDLGRLAKMFFDFKSPGGLLFILKQNILSRTGVKTEASRGAGYAGGLLNEGVYLPLGTLIDAGLGWAGIHMNKQGIDPIGVLRGPNGVIGNEKGLIMGGNLAIRGYQSVIGNQTEIDFNNLDFNELSTNRLVAIYNSVQLGKSTKKWTGLGIDIQPNIEDDFVDPVMLKYGGGPGSILGIGKTSIFFSSQRTGKENPKLSLTGFFKEEFTGLDTTADPPPNSSPIDSPMPGTTPNISITKIGFLDYSVFKRNPINYRGGQIFKTTKNGEFLGGASGMYDLNNNSGLIDESYYDISNDDGVGGIQKFQNSVYKVTYETIANLTSTSERSENIKRLLANGENSKLYDSGVIARRVWDQRTIIIGGLYDGRYLDGYPTDFRRKIIDEDSYLSSRVKFEPTVEEPTQGKSTILALSPDYLEKNRHKRVNQGDPGRHQTGMGEEAKNIFRYGLPAQNLKALDKITAMPMYEATSPNLNFAVNDFVKFRFKILKNEPGDMGVYLHFRAYIDSFNDSYSANWGAVNYVGRGEPMYNYQGFGRSINLSFTVVAESKAELVPMLSKLNYLASSMTPDYGLNGFMKGNLIKLTLGAYLYETPGVITSLTYDIPEDASWEIAIDEYGGADSSVAELPKMIKVTMTFQPIHNFLAQKDANINNPSSKFISMARASDDGLYKNVANYKFYEAGGESTHGEGEDI
jgi:hypothetical protein